MSTSISSNSTVQELLSVIKLSSEQNGPSGKVRDEAERILIRRDEELRDEVRVLKGEVNRLKIELDFLGKLHNFAETEKVSVEEELKQRRLECEELSGRVNRLMDEHQTLVYSMIKEKEMHRNEMEKVKRAEAERLKTITVELKKNKELEEVKRAEAEGIKMAEVKMAAEAEGMKTIAAELKKKNKELEEVTRAEAEGRKAIAAELQKKHKELEEVKTAEVECLKTIAELKKKNKEMEEEIMHYRDSFQQRMSNVEEIAASLLGKDVSVARKGNQDDGNSCRCSMMLRSSSYSSGNHSSHRQNQDLFPDNCDIDVCKKKPVRGSAIAAAEGPNTPIYIIDSDDEFIAEESLVIAKTNGVNLKPSLNEIPSVNKKIPSVRTGEKHDIKVSSCNFVYERKRKRSLGRGDEANGSVMSREKTQDAGEIFHDDKCLSSNGVNLDSTFKETPSVNTEDKNCLNQSFDLVNRRKTGLSSGDGANKFDDDNGLLFKDCSTNDKSVAFGIEGNVTPRKRHLEINDLQEIDGKLSGDQPSLRKHNLTVNSDSDDGFTADSDIDNTIAKLRKKTCKTAADLASELKKNYELCMKAVCALYRRTVSDENLPTDPSNPSIPATPGLSHFIAMGGKELAELLTKGDQKQRPRTSVAELKIKCPEVLKRCRELAIQYNEKLFEIYRKGEDPFFCCACI